MLSYDESRAPRFSHDMAMQIRHAYIRKVYAIVGTQLMMTGLVALALLQLGAEYLNQNPSFTLGLMLFALVTSISMMCIFFCKPGLLRKYPQNYIILFLFTLAEAIVVGMISVQYTRESVIITLGITSFIVFALTLFACQTSIDFTGCGPYLFVGLLCLSLFGFFMWLSSFFLLGGPAFQTMNLVYACGGALLFSCYIVYDTQLIVGGKHGRSNEFTVDDYVPAAISLYLDIVQLFIFLLRIFGDRR